MKKPSKKGPKTTKRTETIPRYTRCSPEFLPYCFKVGQLIRHAQLSAYNRVRTQTAKRYILELFGRKSRNYLTNEDKKFLVSAYKLLHKHYAIV